MTLTIIKSGAASMLNLVVTPDEKLRLSDHIVPNRYMISEDD